MHKCLPHQCTVNRAGWMVIYPHYPHSVHPTPLSVHPTPLGRGSALLEIPASRSVYFLLHPSVLCVFIITVQTLYIM